MIKKFSAFNGLILGILSIFGAFVLEGGSVHALFLIPPIIIVFGGTFAAVIIGFGYSNFVNMFKLMKLAYFPQKFEPKRVINSIVQFSYKARKEGLLALDRDINKVDYFFAKKLLRNAVDGTDPDSLQDLAELEIKSVQERHYSNIFIFTKMGGYAPTMGILGTVMGLIMALSHAGSDPNLLIKSIATAFIATLWGVFSANLIWLPIADKLKKCHQEEKQMMELSLQGVLALQSGEVPALVKARLVSMLSQKEQESMLPQREFEKRLR
ncbi:MAG: MotA/TolQ/ExbB proton channel family protein [Ignavibacteriaceae bacterium]|nr:MotA/TolQ/ExbB proton channel family protein [Ignavibacterium sp.]MCC6256013.1 MotA/TolQ/ExbB proton channel family protein [Ignavibacteriaceae bacterium]HMN22886.1 MotA/TolQ/ExbB proton channel family protein [Ignavibacteriaceae bacterium]HRN25656.1 MotA/TolQ/ExbB proton channel family protein [Ignavibacteriaceae bacterium]HRP91708.1 MotA/TolQ/ExbB proton channel family protein [Ignavibacteriaceae bacterium]